MAGPPAEGNNEKKILQVNNQGHLPRVAHKIQKMAYWYLDKQTNRAAIYGSITALCKETGIKPDNLYTAFSRNKAQEFENDSYRIVKTEIKRS